MHIMNSEKAIQLEGTIMMVLPGTMFRVALANERRFSRISPERCANVLFGLQLVIE